MAVLNGLGGAVVFPDGISFNVKAWSADIEISQTPTTEIGELWRDQAIEEMQLSASIVGQLADGTHPFPDLTDRNTDSLSGEYTLQVAPDYALTFVGTITSWRPGRTNSASSVVLQVISKGEVTLNWFHNFFPDDLLNQLEDPSTLTPPPQDLNDFGDDQTNGFAQV